MKLMQQNTNFGAIKLKGVEPGSAELTKIREAANKLNFVVKLDLNDAANSFYINTRYNSGAEFDFLKQITTMMAGKKIEATSISDTAAKKAILNWNI